MQRRCRRLGWFVLTCLALLTGLGAFRYALSRIPYPAPLPNFYERRNWLIVHAVFASVALVTGPWQLLSGLRRWSLSFHRWLGRIYGGAVAAGWFASLPIAVHAQTGVAASVGFLMLGAFWMGTTAAGYFTIRARRVAVHREWMIRSFALTAAAITLRLHLPIFTIADSPFAEGYPLVAWMRWIPNLLFAEWLLRRRGDTTADMAA